MTEERWRSLQSDDSIGLTQDEIAFGWHWCYEFDGLLVGPGSEELKWCRCLAEDHPVYKTIPPDEDFKTSISPFDI